jgi:hypothetical protein
MVRQFPDDVLDRLRDTREVRIETSSADGSVHKTIIWVVVDGGDAFVRSYRGARARWFREFTREGDGALHVGRDRIPVRAELATDDQSVARCSRALEEKYRGDPATRAMVRPEVLETTIRLEPA